MFIPNLVGQPFIIQNTNISSGNLTPLGVALNTTAPGALNVINAAPQGEFGSNTVYWTNSQAIAAASYAILGQQFTVSAPIDGDAVGVEVNGSLTINVNQDAILQPLVVKLNAAVGSTWSSAGFAAQPIYLPRNVDSGPATRLASFVTYREQVVIRNVDGSDPSGTYAHGVQIVNTTAAGMTATWMQIAMSVRQLQDQQDVGYRDTRR